MFDKPFTGVNFFSLLRNRLKHSVHKVPFLPGVHRRRCDGGPRPLPAPDDPGRRAHAPRDAGRRRAREPPPAARAEGTLVLLSIATISREYG